ncbi:MAG: hypothetical protein JRG69_01465 [Deltaproteobacteria bacterium]|nr:hypothetical protein [Deltaproteobacteria bacterium]
MRFPTVCSGNLFISLQGCAYFSFSDQYFLDLEIGVKCNDPNIQQDQPFQVVRKWGGSCGLDDVGDSSTIGRFDAYSQSGEMYAWLIGYNLVPRSLINSYINTWAFSDKESSCGGYSGNYGGAMISVNSISSEGRYEDGYSIVPSTDMPSGDYNFVIIHRPETLQGSQFDPDNPQIIGYAHSIRLNIVDRHDLSIGSIQLPATMQSGNNTYIITVPITNNGDVNEAEALVNLTISNNNGYVLSLDQTISVNKGATQNASFDWNTLGLSPGTYNFDASVTIADDVNLSNNSSSVQKDLFPPPELSITCTLDKTSYSEGEQILLTATTAVNATVTYVIKDSLDSVVGSGLATDPEDDGSYNESLNAPLLPGDYTVEVTVTKIGYLPGTEAKSFTVNDTQSPTVPILISPSHDSFINNPFPTLDWDDSSDAGSGIAGYEIEIDDNSDFSSPIVQANPTTSSYTVSSQLQDGSYYWRVRAKDNSGNPVDPEQGWSNTFKFTVDTVNPAISITSPTESPYETTQTVINASGTASDNSGISNITWTNNCNQTNGISETSDGWSNWTASINLCFGQNNLSFKVQDMAGNNELINIIVNCQPHEISFSSLPLGNPNPAQSGGMVQCFSLAEDTLGHDVTYQWSASAGEFNDPTSPNPIWTAPQNTTGSTQEYQISVTATCTEDDQVYATAAYQQSILTEPAILHHFAVSAPSEAFVNEPFGLTITALNQYGATFETYSGTVNLTHNGSGNLIPNSASGFVNGVLMLSSLSYDQEETIKITVADTVDLTKEGQSGDIVFTVEDANHAPELNSGDVDPDSGAPSTTFTYTVNYYDHDGDSPSTRNVYIGGSPHTMTRISGSESNGTYQYQTTLSAGSYNYYFYFTDGNGGSDRLPSSGTRPGPSVFEDIWYLHELISGDGPQQEPGWCYGTIAWNSDGTATYSVTNHNGQTDSGTSPWQLSISNNGIITDPSNPSAELHGIRSADKRFMVYTQSEQPKDQPKLSVLVKRDMMSPNFSNGDLEGTWSYEGLISGDTPTQTPGWYWGSYTFDENGVLINATPVTDSLGNSDYVPDDPGFNVGSEGILTSSGVSNFRGVMNDNKDMIFAVATMCPGRDTDVCGYNLLAMIKEGATSFNTVDLQGYWHVHGLTSGDSPQWTGWLYGSLNVDSAGNFTCSVQNSDGETNNQEGTLSITSNGIVTFVEEASNHGVMNVDKDIIILTMDDGGEGYDLLVFVKGTRSSKAMPWLHLLLLADEGPVGPVEYVFSDYEDSMTTYAWWSSDKREGAHGVIGEGTGGYYFTGPPNYVEIGWCSESLCNNYNRLGLEIFEFTVDFYPNDIIPAVLRIHTYTPDTESWYSQVGFDVYINDVKVGSGISSERGSDKISEILIEDQSVIQKGTNDIYIVYNEDRTGYGFLTRVDWLELVPCSE